MTCFQPMIGRERLWMRVGDDEFWLIPFKSVFSLSK